MSRWLGPRNLVLMLAFGVPLLFAAHGIRLAPAANADGASPSTAPRSWVEAGPSCRTGAPSARISLAELQKRLAGQGGDDAADEIVLLNGNGYNYGGDSLRIETGRLLFEAAR